MFKFLKQKNYFSAELKKAWILIKKLFSLKAIKIILVILLFLLLAPFILFFILRPKVQKNINYGVTFSNRFCDQMGLNWREVYVKSLDELYIKNINKGINNWDLIDLTSPKIVGAYLLKKDRSVLYKLAKGSLWHKRVSIISTFWFLKHGELQDTYKLAEVLLCEKHDLLQKAVGWSLREMGKFDFKLLCKFLDEYAATMPRTALRYSLEKFPQERRQYYMKLNKKIVR